MGIQESILNLKENSNSLHLYSSYGPFSCSKVCHLRRSWKVQSYRSVLLTLRGHDITRSRPLQRVGQTNFKLTKECMGISGTANARKQYLKCHKYPPNQFYLEVGRLKAYGINSHGKRDKENVFLTE